jgi:hypothetical protein
MFFRVMILLGVLLVLVAGSAINAAPTISNCNRMTDVFAVLPNTCASIPFATNFAQDVEHGNSTFAAAADFLKAPSDAATVAASPPHSYSKNLPPVPGTVLMVLSGFLCVSLVKDRRVWLAVFAGLLWTGQAGIQFIPHLAQRFSYSSNSRQRPCTEISRLYYRENSHRLRSDLEGTRYIGLLRHLAGIPRSYGYKYTPVLQAAATFFELSGLNSQVKCLFGKTSLFIHFSPAFIFNNLARAPPDCE